MEDVALRLLIRSKLSDGRLPQYSIPQVWGGPGNNETCHACNETISKAQLIIEAIGADSRTMPFHVQCFNLWNAERREAGHAFSNTGRPHA